MKIKGKFIVREVAGEIIVVPVDQTALSFNGMICLNAVSQIIWNGLQVEKTRDEILQMILEEFEVSREDAAADLDAFLLQLKDSDLLEF